MSHESEENLKDHIYEFFIISHDSHFYYAWNAFIITMCFISSFIYANIAAFPADNESKTKMFTMIYLESIFLFDFIVNFLVDYI